MIYVCIQRAVATRLTCCITFPAAFRYQPTLQWSDATILFFASGPIKYNVFKNPEGPFCTYVEEDWFNFDSCTESVAVSVLCDLTSARENRQTSDVLQELHVPNRNKIHPEQFAARFKFETVECPGGHVTHSFLACDARSSCWGARDFKMDASSWGERGGTRSPPFNSVCGVSLKPLPPAFTCDNGVQSVPYTLVCDYRWDCSDSSDEEFCHFPACDLVVKTLCRNTQV